MGRVPLIVNLSNFTKYGRILYFLVAKILGFGFKRFPRLVSILFERGEI